MTFGFYSKLHRTEQENTPDRFSLPCPSCETTCCPYKGILEYEVRGDQVVQLFHGRQFECEVRRYPNGQIRQLIDMNFVWFFCPKGKLVAHADRRTIENT